MLLLLDAGVLRPPCELLPCDVFPRVRELELLPCDVSPLVPSFRQQRASGVLLPPFWRPLLCGLFPLKLKIIILAWREE